MRYIILRMFDDFRAFYHERVLAAFRAFRNGMKEERAGRSVDLGAAVDACEAVFHLRDHLPPEHAMTRGQVEAECAAFAVVGDIANATKHREIDNKTPHGPPLVTSAKQLEEVIRVIRYEDEEGEYWGTSKQVRATLNDGSTVDVLQAVTDVMNFWEQKLAAIRVLQYATPIAFDDGLAFRSRKDCESTPTLELTRGVRFRQNLQFMNYNATTGRSEPLPLPGGPELQLHIRERPYTHHFTMKDRESGREFHGSVTLTVEETVAMDALPPEKKAGYLYGLPSVQAAMRAAAAGNARR